MYVRRSNAKRLSVAVCICVVFYFIFSSGYHSYQIDTVVSKARPDEVWEYVADFSKMRILNPSILNFRIIADSGNAHDWHYTVLYTERLTHWPYWLNTIRGDYVVTQSMPGVPPVYAIDSKHETCFFKGIYCLQAQSAFKFSSLAKEDTYCQESIRYQCPPFLSSACRRELEYQRKAVMHNLTAIFAKKQRNTV